MKTDFQKPEILAPAGDREKLEAALRFGADAVYLAGKRFGMRQAAGNFTPEELDDAARHVHSRGAKIYLTLNTLPHTGEYQALRDFIAQTLSTDIDGFIVTDLGVLSLLRELRPDAKIHVSTQASVCSVEAARGWAKLGASRLVLARELTLDEIAEIREGLPDSVELVVFVQGSMCVSYFVRCLLSNMLNSRDANRGECS
ncbi:MAG: U32 family peptidase, partial [Clostridia bacterium]|nr:U32 family peptidase [Clostridia bacterium]